MILQYIDELMLTCLYNRRRTNNCYDLVHKSPIGVMEPRRGGLSVRLTYFVTPYDQIDIANRDLVNLSINSKYKLSSDRNT